MSTITASGKQNGRSNIGCFGHPAKYSTVTCSCASYGSGSCGHNIAASYTLQSLLCCRPIIGITLQFDCPVLWKSNLNAHRQPRGVDVLQDCVVEVTACQFNHHGIF